MTTPQSILFVEAILAVPLLILGISHICQRQMWIEFFEELAAKGEAGVIWRTFLFEIWPAIIIVVAHQDWQWPGLAITVYGNLLLAKVTLSLLFPQLGLHSLKQAKRFGGNAFVVAGALLVLLGALCAYRVAPLYLA